MEINGYSPKVEIKIEKVPNYTILFWSNFGKLD